MRYPLPMPFGWFQVAWPDEVPAGKAVPLYYFGRHLVAWRGENPGPHTPRPSAAKGRPRRRHDVHAHRPLTESGQAGSRGAASAVN